MTRVAVNLLWCLPGRVGGSEQYLVRQIAGLHDELGREFDVHAYVPRGFSHAHPRVADAATLHETRSSQSSRLLRVATEATWFASHARSAALVHHGGGTLPPRSPQPSLLTVHDLQYLAYPEHFSAGKLRYLSSRVPVSVRRATRIAVPSEYVRRTVVERLGVQEDKVCVVRHGVESSLGSQHTSETSCANDSASEHSMCSRIRPSRIRTRTTTFSAISWRVRCATATSRWCSPAARVARTTTSRDESCATASATG